MTVHPTFVPPSPGSVRLAAVARRLNRRLASRRSRLAASAAAARAYRELLRTVMADSGSVSRQPTAAEITRATSDPRARSVLVDELVTGAAGAPALVRCVRSLTAQARHEDARALASAAGRVRGLAEAAHAAGAVVALAGGRVAEAQDRLRGVSRRAAIELVPAELVAVEFAMDRRLARRTCHMLLTSAGPRPDPESWVSLSRTCRDHGENHLGDLAAHRAAAASRQ